MAATTTPTFVSRQEAARILAASLDTVDRLRSENKITTYRLGSRVRLDRDELLRVLRSEEDQP